MSCSITCSNKILSLAIAPFLFILLGTLCEIALVPGVYILLPPQEEGEEEVQCSSSGYIFTHSAVHSSKKFKPLSDIILLCQG